jgi:hypothetical protein
VGPQVFAMYFDVEIEGCKDSEDTDKPKPKSADKLREVARARGPTLPRAEEERQERVLRSPFLVASLRHGIRLRVGDLETASRKRGRRGEAATVICKAMATEHYPEVANGGNMEVVRGRAGRCSGLHPLCGGHVWCRFPSQQGREEAVQGPGPASLCGQHGASASLKQARPP